MENVKNQGKLIAKEERNGRMFTLDVNMPEVNSMLFTHGKKARDIGIWASWPCVRNYCTPSPLRYAFTIKTRLEVELLCSVV